MADSTKSHLPHYRVRPRFKFKSQDTIPAFIDKVRQGLQRDNVECIGKIDSSHISLLIPSKDQHYWSPQLSITFETVDDEVVVRGMYGPNPAVWTMFVFFYGLIAFAIIAISMAGFSQISLGHSAPILWIVPGLIIAFFSLYLVAYFGQKTGEEQMIILHEFLEESTGLIIDDDLCITN